MSNSYIYENLKEQVTIYIDYEITFHIGMNVEWLVDIHAEINYHIGINVEWKWLEWILTQ